MGKTVKKFNKKIQNTAKLLEPKYKIGDRVRDKYTIIQIYEDIKIRYLCKSDKGYKEMFFEEDL